MAAAMLIVQVCDFLDDGDGRYRLHEPSRFLSRLPGVTVVDCHYYHRLLPPLIDAADVLVLPFVHNEDLFPIIERRRAAGRITVFEANDDFYDIQPWNRVGPAWQDRAIQEEYRHFMEAADAVQTSTEALARRWRPHARRVAVFANQLTDVPRLAAPPARPLTVGWGGSPGHFADWYQVAPLLERWLLAHPEVHLAVMTNELARSFMRLPAERYHFTPFGSLADYFRFLPALDIGLAPLLPTDYNRGRSDVKYLEYAVHGVAGIYADLAPYRESVISEETGLIYRAPEDLIRQLDRLAADPALRQRIRQRAYEEVARDRRLADHIGERLEFYQSLLPQPPSGSVLPQEVVAAAVADGRYLQLRPQPPEQVLLAALQRPVPPEAVPALAQLVQASPNYTAALHEMGRLLTDLRRSREAVGYLDRALALDAASARARCELGRAYFLLGDVITARRQLEEALRINPYYSAGWQYLFRLLALHPDAAAARPLVEQARSLHPDNFQLALAAARTLPAGDGPAVLTDWLERFADGLKPEERPTAIGAFSQAAADLLGARLEDPVVQALLERAAATFPESARLADLLGRALRLRGDEAGSRVAYERALALRRQAMLFRQEYPKGDEPLPYWYFAEHLGRCASVLSDERPSSAER